MNRKTKILLIILIALIVGGLLFYVIHQHRQMREMVEQLEFEKEELQEEYEDLAIQFDGYQDIQLSNDSLTQKLAEEQQRVRDLLEELRITKVTNARRIAELKKELATVRSVMQVYVRQIDSLNVTNERLTNENRQLANVNTQLTTENTQLTSINTQLTQTVSRAAMLEVTDFRVTTLNKRDRKTSLFSQIQKLQFDYTILKNITCTPGIKTVYLRIVRPDGVVMQKSPDNLFPFENGQVEYSVKQDIEYGGEQLSATLYWPVEEILQTGVYNADFFIEGNLVGSFPFTLKK